jgi:hypothetical protein
VEQGKLQGWHADPFGLHGQRYFSGGEPTKLVRDGDVESYDDIPGQEPPAGEDPAVVAAETPGTAADTDTPAAVRGQAPAGDAQAPAGDAETPAGDAEAPAGEPKSARSTSAAGTAGPAGSLVAVGAAFAGRARRRPLITGAIALATAAVVLAIVAIAGGFSSSSAPDISAWNGTGPSPAAGSAGSVSLGMAPAAFVTSAAQRTLTQKSADVTLTGTVGGNGRILSLHGSGQVDLAGNDAAFSLSTSYSGSTLTENEFLTSKDVFLQVALNGHSWNVGGHQWMELPLAQSLATSVPLQSPAWSLQLLEQQGAQVVPVHTQNIGGLSCSEFTVTPTQQAMLSAAAQQEFSKAGLTKPERTTAQQLLRSANPPTLTIWFDPKRQLACQMDVSMPLSTDASPPSGTSQSIELASVQMTFTHYGAQVHISPPAQSDAVLF